MTAPGSRPLLVDLCCKQGGAAMGYWRAGFAILGVDVEPQPRFPFPFVQADAMQFLASADLGSVAAIHASPPCKRFARVGWAHRFGYHGQHEDLLTPMRAALERAGKPWVIENVAGAPMRPDLKLCGCGFGLDELERERWFETSWRAFDLRTECRRKHRPVSPRGHPHYAGEADDWARALGIDWMSAAGLSQAIPPAYTEYVGGLLLADLGILAA